MNNKKEKSKVVKSFILGFAVSLLIVVTAVYAVETVSSSSVSFNSTRNSVEKLTELSSATNVQDAIDLLKGRAFSFLLNQVDPGSYVSYTGTNGCKGKSCQGVTKSYCRTGNYKFRLSGWRVAYIKDSTAYLVSAGAPECLCTGSDGVAVSSAVGETNKTCSSHEATAAVPKHKANLAVAGRKYCNPDYAYGGKCDSSSARSFMASDFKLITGKTLSNSSCYNTNGDGNCGEDNSLIEMGGYYWYQNAYSSTVNKAYYRSASDSDNFSTTTNYAYGVRPILRLKASVRVVGGTGTQSDPYIITPS